MYRRCIGSSNSDINVESRSLAFQMMTKNIFWHAAVIVNYWQTSGKLVAQLAAKK